MPEIFLEINRYFALTSYCNTIGQANNTFSILEFLWRENEESMFCSFQPLADKTTNEHLPKPFFKDIRKSLYFPRNKADWVNGAHRYPRTKLIAEFSDKNREREKCKFTQNALLDGIAVRFNLGT